MASFIDNFSDLRELGIDCEDDSLTETFNKAANHLSNLVADMDNQTLLTLYGYYKQGSQGPCNMPKPSWYDIRAKSKWEAWNRLGDMSLKEAKITYIEKIKKLDPSFNPSSKESWVSVSTLQNEYTTVEGEKTIIDYVKEEDCPQIEEILKSSRNQIDKLDEDGLGLIHWAADRGSLQVLQLLVRFGADVNFQDSDGQTALHYASSCGHLNCIEFLLEQNCRSDILDNEGMKAKDVATDATVKELLENM